MPRLFGQAESSPQSAEHKGHHHSGTCARLARTPALPKGATRHCATAGTCAPQTDEEDIQVA